MHSITLPRDRLLRDLKRTSILRDLKPRELARFGIRVMTVAPGIFLTPLFLIPLTWIQDALAAKKNAKA